MKLSQITLFVFSLVAFAVAAPAAEVRLSHAVQREVQCSDPSCRQIVERGSDVRISLS